ncbi:hypothetical protein OA40_07700 [Morganella morganii]|nr:hypothetical protein OA40_07700 [Morganella morganii]KNZ87285.1 hypothetical protein AKG16_11800 [Morganella morganii]
MQNRPDNRPDFFVLPVCSGELLITGKTKSRCKYIPVSSGASSMTRMLFVRLPVIRIITCTADHFSADR